MKGYLILILVAVSINSFGQEEKQKSLLVSANVGLGSHIGIVAKTSVEFENNCRLGLSYSYFIRRAASTPNDFDTGIIERVFFLNTIQPLDILNNCHAHVGKVWSISNHASFYLDAGVGMSKLRRPEDWSRNNNFPASSNYSYSNKSYNLFSFSLNPHFEIQPAEWIDFIVGPYFLHTGEQGVLALNAGIQFKLN